MTLKIYLKVKVSSTDGWPPLSSTIFVRTMFL